MQKPNLPTNKVIALILVAMTLVSSSVFANVYKWRDSRGVTQYSDTLPTTSYSTVKGSELVNALQSKDVCALPSAKLNANNQSKKLSNLSTNFDFRVGGSPKIAPNLLNYTPESNTGIQIGNTGNIGNIGNIGNHFSKTGNQLNNAGSNVKIPVTIAKITKFVASHAMPTIISSAATIPVVKHESKLTVSSMPTSATSSPVLTPVSLNFPHGIIQAALMPAVDISKNMIPAIGFNTLRLAPTTEQRGSPADGAFRIVCAMSHMSNDDPLVFPNQPGAAHHHTFFGNTSTNAKSDLMNLQGSGNSTCNGGIMNKSAYWIPSMIDTATGTPLKSDNVLIYYKSGDSNYPSDEPVIQPPKGLRMITGNSKGTQADELTTAGHYICETTGKKWSATIPNCPAGDNLLFSISFLQCWDGKNLDSPDHKSHMAERVGVPGTDHAVCPVDHPVRIPQITINVHYKNTVKDAMKNWRLSSDNYPTTIAGGLSAHADWVNGWDEKLFARVIAECIQARLDCHATMVGKDIKMY